MAIDFGRAARGIATGYLTAKVADTARQDEINGEFIQAAASNYFNEDRPNFLKQEELRYNNFLRIKRDKGLAFAQLADSEAGGFATTSEVGTNNFLRTVAQLKPDQIQAIETNYNERKSERVQTFNEKNAYLKNYFKGLPGGLADNTLEIQLPDEGKDVGITGIKQDMPMEAATAEPATGLLDITSNVYNIDNTAHRNIESKAATQFNQLFFDRVQQKYNFSIPGDKNDDGSFKDSRYPTLQVLKEGYADAVKQGYEFGFEVYARDKFIQRVMESRGITGYTGLLPPETQAAEAATTEAAATTTETKAVPEDGKKFDAPDTSQIGVKEDAKINILSNRTMEGGGTSSAAVVLNDLREIIAKISDSPSLSDDEKEERIELAKQRARDRIQSMGLDLDKFNI